MLQLLKRNVMKRIFSWKTIVLFIIGVGTMLTYYNNIQGSYSEACAYLILEGPGAVFMQVVSPENTLVISYILLAIMIIYFLETPMINQDDRFYIMRIGKKSWVIVEILGVLIASIIWIFLINIMGCIASAGNMDWTDWRIYPDNMACMLIYLMGYTCIGLAVLLFHLLNIKALGTAIITTLMLLERFILYVLPNNIGLFLEDEKMVKVVNMVKKVTFMGRLESGYLSDNLHSSIIYFGVLAAVLIALNLIYVKKHEIG